MIDGISHVIFSTLASYSILSLLEYATHRFIMHKPTLSRILGTRLLSNAFVNHAVLHHKKCYAIFDRESGPCALMNIAIKQSTSILVYAPPCLVIFSIDPLTSLVLLLGGPAHSWIWSEVHLEMHSSRCKWYRTSRVFLYLKQYHYLHHRHPGTNFNFLFPMWDWILGTAAIETEDDRKEIAAGTWRVRHSSLSRARACT